VYRRILGTPLTEDVLVYEESNPQWFVDVSISKDNRLICLNSNDRVSSEVRILDSSRPFESPQLVHPRETGVQYFVEHNHVRSFPCSPSLYPILNADVLFFCDLSSRAGVTSSPTPMAPAISRL
jgi:protease II